MACRMYPFDPESRKARKDRVCIKSDEWTDELDELFRRKTGELEEYRERVRAWNSTVKTGWSLEDFLDYVLL